ncbi:MAG: transcription termination/antitermination factor NusG [Planctomycetes bacterium]|nr:transcription termination/antitermination factor NusG [Planctomycetota bacterium]
MDKKWYVVRVQTGREEFLKTMLEKQIKEKGLDSFVARILVPVEKVSEIRGGKKKVVGRKLYPGYIMVEMELNDQTKVAIRETPGIGDFVGSKNPVPLQKHEVEKMLMLEHAVESGESPKIKIAFKKNDNVRIKEGAFENLEGVVEEVIPSKGLVKVLVTIFGRSTEVELEYWQLEAI